MSDGFFYLGALVFLFILWATTGGPTRPISFAGAYITPITNVGETQTGYGPKLQLGGTLAVGSSSASIGENPAQPAPTYDSPYSSFVRMNHMARRASTGTSVSQGYVQIFISSSAGKDIDITGWKLENVAGASATISNGILLMRIGSGNKLQDILLRPGDVASLSNETSPIGASFEVNKCAGYLSSQQSLYNPCVSGHASEPGFLTGTWYVYLGQSAPLWQASGTTLTLLDENEKTVDVLSY